MLTFLVVVAFALQSYLTQTHIHVWGPAADSPGTVENYDEVGGLVLSPTKENDHGKQPADDPAHCPFCQAVALSGTFFVPVAPVLPLPVVFSVLEYKPPTAYFHTISRSHDWQIRAPPVA